MSGKSVCMLIMKWLLPSHAYLIIGNLKTKYTRVSKKYSASTIRNWKNYCKYMNTRIP